MIRRVLTRWRQRRALARSHGPILRGLVGDLNDRERDAIADYEHRWNGGQR